MPAVLISIGCLMLTTLTPLASATSIQSQINNLHAQNSKVQSSVNTLGVQASNYKGAIKKLKSQIGSVQSAITASQARQAKLNAEIQVYQTKLNKQKQILGSDIKSMYVNGQMSTIEELASSKNLSSFVDAQTYRNAVQNEVQSTLKQISKLQNKLNDQKQQVSQLLNGQQLQSKQLAADKQQQTQLLALNHQQQASYTKKLKANQAKIGKLESEQIAINQAAQGRANYGGTGSYPYANAVCLNDPPGHYNDNDCNALKHPGLTVAEAYNWGFPPSNSLDPLGWNYRNCTSYVFWKVAHVSRVQLDASNFPNESANGGGVKYSILDFEAQGYKVNQNPRGSIVLAVETAGTYGHIMYVENSSTANTNNIQVSQYNVHGGGLYSTAPLYSSSSIYFVHIK
ncbi:MAG: CHAP domain-containing protein [Candidatus Saccharimonadales bacterium]